VVDGDEDGDGFSGSICVTGDDCNDARADINPGMPEVCDNGLDDNCDGLSDCDDPWCNGVGECGGCSSYETSCSDRMDNDCDGRTDCADPECFATRDCPCRTYEADCSNAVDDDCDGKVDCNDSECSSSSFCSCQSRESCSNNRDDDCDGAIDCLDSDCKTQTVCACVAQESSCVDGRDEDCDGKFDCDDSDCSSRTECTCRTAHEDCSDGVDDNCNGLVDCQDPGCASSWACSCGGTSRKEICSDTMDNDCDGLPDCMDPDCLTAANCSKCLVAESCQDQIDNDCDGLIDCLDPECIGKSPNCMPAAEVCNDKRDNDFDDLIDCADPDCRNADFCKIEHATCVTALTVTASGTFTGTTIGHPIDYVGSCGGHGSEAIFALVLSAPSHVTVDTKGSNFDTTLYMRTGVCAEGPEIACNDDGGFQPGSIYAMAKIELPLLYPGLYYLFVDGFAATDGGFDSGPYVVNIDIVPNPPEVCDNGADDDGDIYVDCADSDCRDQSRCKCNAPTAATAEYGITKCNDGVDNDCDGLIDGADKADCRASENYPDEICNGKDDNGNGIEDDYSCRCASDNDCDMGNVCYSLVHACSLPCYYFVGSSEGGICPAIANGSVCSTSSGQCVYP
jgi:hypothetical protein